MLAIKAVYENGEVRWMQRPPDDGRHDLIVVFEDIPEARRSDDAKTDGTGSQPLDVDRAIERIQHTYSDIPQSVSLVDELIAERRREAINEWDACRTDFRCGVEKAST